MTAVHAVSQVPVDSLRPHPRNYRDHPEDQLAHIVRSLQLHGFYRNVVVARDGTILAGHGVVLAARSLGLEFVPAIRLDVDPEDTRALQVLAGDNEISNLGVVDDRQLTELLRDLAAEDWDDLLGTGFDQQQLAALALVTRPRAELADFDAAAEWVGLPAFDAPPDDHSIRVTVRFLTVEARDEFVEHCGISQWTRQERDIWTAWVPHKPMDDRVSVKFE